MTRIGITGASGFIGLHVRSMLQLQERSGVVAVRCITRYEFNDPHALAAIVRDCDVLLHLAGSNTGSEKEIRAANEGLAQKLIAACDAVQVAPHVIFTSSIYADPSEKSANPERPAVFGESKRAAGQLLEEWGGRTGAPVSIFILPHVFGEFAPPFHNSAVATLCHQLVRGEPSEIREEAVVELVYVRNVVSQLLHTIRDGEGGPVRVIGSKMPLLDVNVRLCALWDNYRDGIDLKCRDVLDAELLLTLHYHILHNSFQSDT